jgi:hypothetical protein
MKTVLIPAPVPSTSIILVRQWLIEQGFGTGESFGIRHQWRYVPSRVEVTFEQEQDLVLFCLTWTGPEFRLADLSTVNTQ